MKIEKSSRLWPAALLGLLATVLVPPPASARSLVTAGPASLRRDSLFTSKELRKLPNGAEVVYLDYQSDVTGLMRVAAGRDTGWVSGESLREQPGMAPSGGGCGTSCGFERWAVKTITDPDAGSVTSSPKPTTVDKLRALAAPRVKPQNRRVGQVERTTYQVTAKLVGWKLEGDGDFHLVLASSTAATHTIIAEVPNPDCQGACSSPHAAEFGTVRDALTKRFGQPPASFHRLKPAPSVTVTGIGFFDFKHGQTGVAPNAIEMHPVLALDFAK